MHESIIDTQELCLGECQVPHLVFLRHRDKCIRGVSEVRWDRYLGTEGHLSQLHLVQLGPEASCRSLRFPRSAGLRPIDHGVHDTLYSCQPGHRNTQEHSSAHGSTLVVQRAG